MQKLNRLTAQIKTLSPGDEIFTKEPVNKITAIASKFGIQITTEKQIIVEPVTLKASKIIKITLK